MKGANKMIRPESRLSEEAAKELLLKGEIGVLSTAGADGVPYGIPINYVYSPEENILFFHCATKGRKVSNLIENNKVSLAVVGSAKVVPDKYTSAYESVIVEGKASLITDPDEKRRLLVRLCERFAPHALARRDEVITKYLPATLMIRIDIVSISGKRNQE